MEAAGTKVFTHRRLTVDAEQDEVPCISVGYGEDSPAEGTLQDYESVLTVQTTACVEAVTEEELHEKLLELRAEIHIAVRADPTLALGFVINTNYGPVDRPEVSTRGEKVVGVLTSRWLAHYFMDLANPN